MFLIKNSLHRALGACAVSCLLTDILSLAIAMKDGRTVKQGFKVMNGDIHVQEKPGEFNRHYYGLPGNKC